MAASNVPKILLTNLFNDAASKGDVVAQKSLDEFERNTPGALLLASLELYSDAGVPNFVRTVAIISLRSLVSRKWNIRRQVADKSYAPAIVEADKRRFASLVESLLSQWPIHEPAHLIRMTRRVARFDFPSKWLGLVNLLESQIRNEQMAMEQQAAPSDRSLFRFQLFDKIVKEQVSKRLPSDLRETRWLVPRFLDLTVASLNVLLNHSPAPPPSSHLQAIKSLDSAVLRLVAALSTEQLDDPMFAKISGLLASTFERLSRMPWDDSQWVRNSHAIWRGMADVATSASSLLTDLGIQRIFQFAVETIERSPRDAHRHIWRFVCNLMATTSRLTQAKDEHSRVKLVRIQTIDFLNSFRNGVVGFGDWLVMRFLLEEKEEWEANAVLEIWDALEEQKESCRQLIHTSFHKLSELPEFTAVLTAHFARAARSLCHSIVQDRDILGTASLQLHSLLSTFGTPPAASPPASLLPDVVGPFLVAFASAPQTSPLFNTILNCVKAFFNHSSQARSFSPNELRELVAVLSRTLIKFSAASASSVQATIDAIRAVHTATADSAIWSGDERPMALAVCDVVLDILANNREMSQRPDFVWRGLSLVQSLLGQTTITNQSISLNSLKSLLDLWEKATVERDVELLLRSGVADVLATIVSLFVSSDAPLPAALFELCTTLTESCIQTVFVSRPLSLALLQLWDNIAVLATLALRAPNIAAVSPEVLQRIQKICLDLGQLLCQQDGPAASAPSLLLLTEALANGLQPNEEAVALIAGRVIEDDEVDEPPLDELAMWLTLAVSRVQRPESLDKVLGHFVEGMTSCAMPTPRAICWRASEAAMMIPPIEFNFSVGLGLILSLYKSHPAYLCSLIQRTSRPLSLLLRIASFALISFDLLLMVGALRLSTDLLALETDSSLAIRLSALQATLQQVVILYKTNFTESIRKPKIELVANSSTLKRLPPSKNVERCRSAAILGDDVPDSLGALARMTVVRTIELLNNHRREIPEWDTEVARQRSSLPVELQTSFA